MKSGRICVCVCERRWRASRLQWVAIESCAWTRFLTLNRMMLRRFDRNGGKSRDKFMNWPRRWDKWLKLGRMASLFIGETCFHRWDEVQVFLSSLFQCQCLSKRSTKFKIYVARPAISVSKEDLFDFNDFYIFRDQKCDFVYIIHYIVI